MQKASQANWERLLKNPGCLILSIYQLSAEAFNLNKMLGSPMRCALVKSESAQINHAYWLWWKKRVPFSSVQCWVEFLPRLPPLKEYRWLRKMVRAKQRQKMRIPAESNWESDLYKKEPVSAHFFSSYLRCMFYIGGLRAEQNCGAEVESTRRRWFCGEWCIGSADACGVGTEGNCVDV